MSGRKRKYPQNYFVSNWLEDSDDNAEPNEAHEEHNDLDGQGEQAQDVQGHTVPELPRNRDEPLDQLRREQGHYEVHEEHGVDDNDDAEEDDPPMDVQDGRRRLNVPDSEPDVPDSDPDVPDDAVDDHEGQREEEHNLPGDHDFFVEEDDEPHIDFQGNFFCLLFQFPGVTTAFFKCS